MEMNRIFTAVIAAALIFTGCSSEDDFNPEQDKYTPKGIYDTGIFVVNEGTFDNNNASVSYIGFTSGEVQNNIFSAANGNDDLGDTAQSIAFKDGLAFIIVNGSDKIEVANRYTMQRVATIDGFDNPRYMAIIGSKGYVTNWGDGNDPDDDYVAVIDLTINTELTRIPVAEGPEKILANGNKLYVAQRGGFGYGNTITVLNADTNSTVTTINVGDVPSDIQIENNSLWVACEGRPPFSMGGATAGRINKINLDDNTVTNTYPYSGIANHITHMAVVNGIVWFTMGNDVYKFNPVDNNLPSEKAFSTSATFLYGFAVNNNKMYIADAVDFSSAGKVYVYSFGAADIIDGTQLAAYTVGLNPNGFYFNLQ